MYSLQLMVIAAIFILVPGTSALDLHDLPRSLAPVVIPPGDQDSNGPCPADLERETAQENISSSVQMLLRSLTVEAECGEGSWQRVAYLNMSDPTMECPPSWREYSQDSVRACGRPVTDAGSCPATIYTVDNTQYSKVCGRIIGYQNATPSPFDSKIGRPIDDIYVDGVSVTYGNPRSHIWTFAGGFNDDPNGIHGCPCASTAATASPSFVGNNYFCESGIDHDNQPSNYFVFFPDDPLWDGQNCPSGDCCEFNSPPWFSVDLDGPTTDDIEVRICGDQDTNDEDTPIGLLELYIQ